MSEHDLVLLPVHAWMRATAERDAGLLDEAFHPDAVQVVRAGERRMTLSVPAYKQLLQAGEIGGHAATLEVHAVSVSDAVATVRSRRVAPKMVFEDALSLLREEQGWRIAGAAVVATPR